MKNDKDYVARPLGQELGQCQHPTSLPCVSSKHRDYFFPSTIHSPDTPSLKILWSGSLGDHCAPGSCAYFPVLPPPQPIISALEYALSLSPGLPSPLASDDTMVCFSSSSLPHLLTKWVEWVQEHRNSGSSTSQKQRVEIKSWQECDASYFHPPW